MVSIGPLTTYNQYDMSEHKGHHNRRNCEANPIHAVVVRQVPGRDYGSGGKTMFLTNASVQRLYPFDDCDDRSFIENCWIKEVKQSWGLGHPPQKTGRAVRGHVVFTFLLCILASAFRLYCEQAERIEPVGWQRWRLRLLE